MKTRIGAVMAAIVFVCAQAQAGIISSVTAVSSTVTPTVETLAEGTNIYHDRDPGHRLVNIPVEFDGDADVVVASNSDKTLETYQLEVTTSRLGIIYVGLDSRHAESSPLPWMQDPAMTGLPAEFFNTGRTIDLDEGSTPEDAGSSVENTFDLWATIAPAGTYNFFNQTFGGGSNNYVIIADNKLVPEPATFSIMGLGLMGVVSMLRRRR